MQESISINSILKNNKQRKHCYVLKNEGLHYRFTKVYLIFPIFYTGPH